MNEDQHGAITEEHPDTDGPEPTAEDLALDDGADDEVEAAPDDEVDALVETDGLLPADIDYDAEDEN